MLAILRSHSDGVTWQFLMNEVGVKIKIQYRLFLTMLCSQA